MLDELLAATGYSDWSTDGLGDEVLICPHGNRVEPDGVSFDGCVSPLIEMGLL
jgi:hypothetical protein